MALTGEEQEWWKQNI